ncbi:hypothetical protein EW026_g3267 [Hermanssonia centrifuga]|uniref:Uncharacterized protein n=1 Tax=Hermanssonia centrifuga TaxID=98765 RepID=A0A4S4KKQ6_9APHY|nr:hypothetical protein EW026_g3267 [Hermanssonia centrifuga]
MQLTVLLRERYITQHTNALNGIVLIFILTTHLIVLHTFLELDITAVFSLSKRK